MICRKIHIILANWILRHIPLTNPQRDDFTRPASSLMWGLAIFLYLVLLKEMVEHNFGR